MNITREQAHLIWEALNSWFPPAPVADEDLVRYENLLNDLADFTGGNMARMTMEEN